MGAGEAGGTFRVSFARAYVPSKVLKVFVVKFLYSGLVSNCRQKGILWNCYINYFSHFIVSLKDIRSRSCIGSSGRFVRRIFPRFGPNPRKPLPILTVSLLIFRNINR